MIDINNIALVTIDNKAKDWTSIPSIDLPIMKRNNIKIMCLDVDYYYKT